MEEVEEREEREERASRVPLVLVVEAGGDGGVVDVLVGEEEGWEGEVEEEEKLR